MTNKRQILQFNPWVLDPAFRFEEGGLTKRFVYRNVEEALKLRLIISISGLRRVGKTTILRQLANSCLDKGQKIFYYQFSETDRNIAKVMELAFESVITEPVYKASAVFLLDELHYAKNWQDTLKHYYDMNKNLQFVVTGSSSLYAKKDTKESMAGRILDFDAGVLSFKEYLYLKHRHLSVTDAVEDVIDATASPQEIYHRLTSHQNYTALYKDEVWDYLVQGEFAEIINYQDRGLVFKYLSESVLEKVFSKDIKVFDVEKTDELQKLHKVLMESVSQNFSVLNLSRDLGITRPTVKKYISILQKAYLVQIGKNYLRSIRAQEKSFDRVYTNSLNLLSTVMGISDYTNYRYSDFLGHVVENYVLNKLRRVMANVQGFYFFNKEGKEVDFVIDLGSSVLPCEVKFKDELKPVDVKSLLDFMDKQGLTAGFVFYSGENKVIDFGGGDDKKTLYAVNWV